MSTNQTSIITWELSEDDSRWLKLLIEKEMHLLLAETREQPQVQKDLQEIRFNIGRARKLSNHLTALGVF